MKSSEVKRFAALYGFAPVDVGNPEQGPLAGAWSLTRRGVLVCQAPDKVETLPARLDLETDRLLVAKFVVAWPHVPVVDFRWKVIAKIVRKRLL
jgi:hypothetical protein